MGKMDTQRGQRLTLRCSVCKRPFGIFFKVEENGQAGNLPGKCFVQGFGAGLHMKFVVDAVNVFFNRFLADKEFRGNFFVKVPFGKKIKYFRFAFREQFNRFRAFIRIMH